MDDHVLAVKCLHLFCVSMACQLEQVAVSSARLEISLQRAGNVLWHCEGDLTCISICNSKRMG